jgi:STE24 endopeptidase
MIVLFGITRSFAGRVEARPQDEVDKVHALRLLGMAGMPGAVVLLLGFQSSHAFDAPWLVLGALWPGVTRNAVATSAIGGTLATLMVLGPWVAFTRAWTPSYRRLRKFELPPLRQRVRYLLAAILPIAMWLLVTNVIGGSSLLLLPSLVGLFVLIQLVNPALRVRILPTKPLEGSARERATALARRIGVRIADVRVLETRGERIANAFVMGLFRRTRYVVVTDVLLEQFAPEEFDAVLAHEFGHAKRRHLWLKMLAFFGTAVIAAGLALTFVEAVGMSDGTAAIAIPIVAIVAMIVMRGRFSFALERAADDFGASYTTTQAMVAALERLATVNAVKRKTGLIWNLITQHPAVERRIARLHTRIDGQDRQEIAPDATRD